MRNLHVRNRACRATGLTGGLGGVWCKDPDSRNVYTMDNEGQIFKLHIDSEPELVVDLKSEGLLEENSKCLNMCPLPELQAILLALSTGELLQICVAGGPPADIEEVGSVAGGLLALDMSPDCEIITLVTAELNLILMTRDYTPLSETPIHQAEFGEGKFVNVGWGAKETQFHGSEGKEARAKKSDAGQVSSDDDRKVRLSWRGDGEMLCVSYVTPEADPSSSQQQQTRRIRVFDRQGNLFSTSEDCNGLEQSLSWKPSGNLIATTIRKPNKHVVGFFEKNGLQHGEFTIRAEGKVEEVLWNCDSTILALWIDSTQREGGQHSLQFWTVGNYHWYLKQEILVDGTTNISPKWDTEDPNLFHYFSTTKDDKNTTFHAVTFARETDVSTGSGEDDLALTAAIDGTTVKVTPMREAVVPPPMSAYEIHVEDDQILAVMFQHVGGIISSQSAFGIASNSSNNMALVTRASVHLFAVTDVDKGCKNGGGDKSVRITGAGGNGYIVQTSRHQLVNTLPSDVKLAELCNFVWQGGFIMASSNNPQPALVLLQEKDGKLVELTRFSCEDSIHTISHGSNGDTIIQLSNATVLKFKEGSLETLFEFPRLCSKVISTPHGVLGLTSTGKLYLNDQEIAGNITSMFLHSHFLLATTMDHRLIAVPNDDLANSATLKWEDAGNRRVERGSKLVTAVAHGSRTVLQMPRGNLETIQPRSLTIHLLKDLLNTLKFKEAFLLARRQRLNLNLLVDHDSKLFMDNIKEFVSQVNSESEHLNIFLADLKDENVCITMYSAQYKNQPNKDWPDKVVSVCEAVRTVLEDTEVTEDNNNNNNLVPILATLVRQGNMLEQALQRIQKLRDCGRQNECDNGLRYILYSVDVNLLFNIALGTYDFDLVLMVAEKSQKDPKEYLPILNAYKAMPSDYMKYSIDKDLKRYDSALSHIAKCPDNFEECLKLIQDQRLFKQGMLLFPKGSDNYKSVCKIYGEYLDSKRYYLEASYLFEQAGDYESAVRTSERACSWERAGNLARRAGWSRDQLDQLFKDLAAKLEEMDRGMESALIWKEWLQDAEESIAVLARTKCWSECLRQVRQLGRDDLLETHLLPALQDRKQILQSTISANIDKINEQVNRLEMIRAERSTRMLQQHQDDQEDMEVDGRNLDDADLFSDTTSVGGGGSVATSAARSKSTLATRTSGRSKSGKGRRKQERKLYSTKEGSTHEDLGLIAELHETLSSVPGIIAEIANITRIYLDIGQIEGGLSDLQKESQTMLTLCDDVKPKIWPGQQPVKERYGPEVTVEDIVRGGMNAASGYRSPLELMDAHLRYPPKFNIDLHWKLEIL